MKLLLKFSMGALLLAPAACGDERSQNEPAVGGTISALANPALVCPPGSNVIIGTAGDDVIHGTPAVDCILGRGGNDTIRGGRGGDHIWGEGGNDLIDGEEGNDFIWGGSGNDDLRGGDGDDQVIGNQGNDRVGGGFGNDIVAGNEGDDFVQGEEGNDHVYGHEGNDVLTGGTGNDNMWGGPGNDDVRGQDGDDTVRGGDGEDFVLGGPGHNRTDGNADCDVVDRVPENCSTTCGNNVSDPGEACDDGNSTSGDGCSSLCVVEFCGDSVVQAGLGEQCDDGNANSNDGCSPSCQNEPPPAGFCGDGNQDTGETCDDGNAINGDGCDNNCTPTGCGNGIVTAFEGCDDGNSDNGDGCNASCSPEFICGDGTVDPGEECDDGGLVSNDGCSSLCKTELCGNNVIDAGEDCDDGNSTGGDGCSSACLDEQAIGDILSFGLGGLRGTSGAGEINVAGLSGTVKSALLYWHGPTDVSDPSANAGIQFAASSIVGTNIGFSSDNCWGFTNSQAYRADVTNLISGNGAYAVSGLVKPGVEINGVSLVIIYDDGNGANDQRIYLYDGNDSNIDSPFDAGDWSRNLAAIDYQGGTANLQLHVADGQGFNDGSVLINGSELLPVGPNFDGTGPNQDPSSVANTAGGLWDVHTYEISSFLTVGNNDLLLTSGVDSDCLALIASIVTVPASN